jgi:hypothetical protein
MSHRVDFQTRHGGHVGVETRSLLYGVLLALLGALLAQLFPLFSDPMTRNFCQPLSPCRNSALPGYIVGGLILGIILGAVSGLMQKQSSSASRQSRRGPRN